MSNEPVTPTSAGPGAGWLARLGAVAFLFFLVKGLAWLTVPFLVLWFGVMP